MPPHQEDSGRREPLLGRPPARTLTEHATRAIREGILSGSLGPGSRVQVEDLAADLGMSAIPVREALRTLSSEGLVVPLPQRGFRVPPVTAEDIEDTYRIRRALDVQAVHLAAPRLTDEHFARLEGALERLAASPDYEEAARHHRDFHFVIYHASDSPWLLRFTSMLWGNAERYWRVSTVRRGAPPRTNAEAHAPILSALRRGDVDRAAGLMGTHLDMTVRTVKGLLEEQRLDDRVSHAS